MIIYKRVLVLQMEFRIDVGQASLPDLLYTAPTELYIFFVYYSKNISLQYSFWQNNICHCEPRTGWSNPFNNGNGAGTCSTDVLQKGS